MARIRNPGAQLELERQPLVLGQRPIKLVEIVTERLELDVFEGAALAPRLRPGDLEQRVEGPDHGLGIRQGLLEQGAALGPTRLAQQRHLDARAQPVERRAQIVGDVVGDLAHAGEQPLDLIEHGVEVGGELDRTRRASP